MGAFAGMFIDCTEEQRKARLRAVSLPAQGYD